MGSVNLEFCYALHIITLWSTQYGSNHWQFGGCIDFETRVITLEFFDIDSTVLFLAIVHTHYFLNFITINMIIRHLFQF